jgi:hypothetical protein
MVEISLSGSGEGLGRVIARGYSTRPFFRRGPELRARGAMVWQGGWGIGVG